MPTPRTGETREQMNARRQFIRCQYTRNGKGVLTSETFVRAGRGPDEVVHIPDPAFIARTSTLYGADGEVRAQWVIEKPEDQEREALWREFAKALCEDIPALYPLPQPQTVSSDLMAIYPVGDHHMGMLAWDKETGSSYDLEIGEQLLMGAMTHLVGVTPACDRAAVVFLGDFMHYDSFDAVTPTSRNMLDSDGRAPKMVRAALRTMECAIDLAVLRHREVHVVIELGNHDLMSSIFLMEAMSRLYRDSPRVTVDTAPGHYHYFDFGKNLIGVHHGHGAKPEKLPGIMAHDQAALWGITEHRMWLTGHIHTQKWFDFPGCSVESFRVLPPVDAWAYNKGYRAHRDMKAIVLHKTHGEVARYSVNPAMLEAA